MSSRMRATVALVVLLAQAAPAAEKFEGAQLVAATSRELADTIAARHAEFEADHYALYGLVDGLLLPRFDMQRGSRAILAEHWDSATDADRRRFATAFYNYLVATYGDLLLQYKRETLRVLPFEGDPQRSPARVHTIVTLSDGTKVDVDFVMLRTANDWKVVDVVAEGVSYVKTYRSQFRVQIATEGLGSVIDWLERKAALRFPTRP